VRVVVKGAPEYVLPMCNSQFSENGQIVSMSRDEGERILEQEIVGKCAKRGLRIFAYAFKDIDLYDWESMKRNYNNFVHEEDRASLERELTFVAGFGLNDDLREGVDQCITKL